MRKKFTAVLLLLSVLLALPAAAADSGAGTMRMLWHTVVAPGLETYARVYAGDGEAMQAGYSVELSRDSGVYPIVMACDTMYGGMTLDEITAYAQGLGYNVVGAVNTAFYNTPGIPIGIVVEDGRLRSAADGLNAFAIMEDGSYYTAREPRVRFRLESAAWAEPMELKYLNKGMEHEDIYMYTADFSTVSTRVTDHVWAVRLRITEGTLTLGGSIALEVTEIAESAGAVPIGGDELILTAKKDGAYGPDFARFAVGDVLTLETVCDDERLKAARYITGCGDILVENGKMTDAASWSPFVAGSHPRTLIGWRSDGTLVMYVADGRRSGYAEGLTQQQAAEEMLRQACQFAVNMDGGGSSVLGLRMPDTWTVQPLNRPSDGASRQVAAYLLLVTDEASDGVVRHWHLRENGSLVLPNQRLQLHVYGTDSGLYPAVGTDDVLYSAEGRIFTDGVYRAPARAGVHKISVWGGGASGKGELRVITAPTALEVTMADGSPLRDMTVHNGDKLRLRITASHYGTPVIADESCVRYEMSRYLGTADDDGVFTVDALPDTQGQLTLHIGDASYTIGLKVERSLRDISEFRCKTALDFYKAG